MGSVINRLLLVLLCLFCGTASADTYYEKTTIPPKIAAHSVPCNATASTAAPTQCTSLDTIPVGAGTPSTGAFTTLSASGAVSGTGFDNYLTTALTTPPAIGATTPNTGKFTTLNATTIATGSIASLSMFPTMATNTILCNATGSTTTPTACTNTVVKPLINCSGTFTPGTLSTTSGCQFDGLTLSGVQTSAVAYEPYRISITDSYDGRLNTSGDPDAGLSLAETMQTGWAKGRNVFKLSLAVSGVPDVTDTTVAGNPLVAAQLNSTAGVLNNGTREAPHGQIWVQDNNLILHAGATFWSVAGGLELDNNLQAGSSARNHFGIIALKSSTNAGRGDVIDAALQVSMATDPASNAFSWRTGLLFGSPLGFGFNSDATLIGLTPKLNTATAGSALFDYGIDFRAGTATSGFTAFKNSGTNSIGDTYAGNLVTGSTLTAQSSTIATVAPAKGYGDLTGGAYYSSASFPTLVITAPPNGGTQATATVATMRVNTISLTTGTDSGCSNGDVLTLTGGTGTQGTITLTVVAGAATAAVVTTAGSYTAISATPGSTGGTCSVQPALKVGYGIVTTTVTNAGSGYLAYPPPYVALQGGGVTASTGDIPAYLVPTLTPVNSSLTIASSNINYGGRVLVSATAPTIASGFNTASFSITGVNTAAFQVTVGTSTGTSTGVVTMPTATTGWACSAADVTTPATNMVQQTGYTQTSVTVTNYVRTTGVAGNFTNSDKIVFNCGAF